MVYLTLINLFRRHKIPGNLFTGKHRLVRQVTPKDLRKLDREYRLEEENMKYLLNPYLTKEQSRGHVGHKNKRANRIEFYNNNPIKPKFKPDITIEDRLMHLRVKEVWDV